MTAVETFPFLVWKSNTTKKRCVEKDVVTSLMIRGIVHTFHLIYTKQYAMITLAWHHMTSCFLFKNPANILRLSCVYY